MATVLVRIALDAIVAASAVALYLVCIRPQLRALRAQWPAFALSGALATAVPLTLALTNRTQIPAFLVPVCLVLLLLLWFWPAPLIRVTGGRLPLPEDVAPVFSGVGRALENMEVGDLEQARNEVASLDRWRTANTEHYIDLWQRFVDEEVARRSGTRQSSRETTREMQQEAARLATAGNQLGVVRTSLLVALAAMTAAAPALAGVRACIGVEILLPNGGNTRAAQGSSLAAVLLTDPERGAEILSDEAMDLDTAADSRHDPDTREDLVNAGFVGAHGRIWRATDGRQLTADVFEFRDASGALRYQATVNRYACQFANEAFDGPQGGVGLQVRYSRGDPIVEQTSFVVGTRRFVVSVSALAPPPNHGRVLRLGEQQMEHALH